MGKGMFKCPRRRQGPAKWFACCVSRDCFGAPLITGEGRSPRLAACRLAVRLAVTPESATGGCLLHEP